MSTAIQARPALSNARRHRILRGSVRGAAIGHRRRRRHHPRKFWRGRIGSARPHRKGGARVWPRDGTRCGRQSGRDVSRAAEPDLPFLACGSHLDSVPQGGNFDGGAGVIAALAVLAGLKRDGFRAAADAETVRLARRGKRLVRQGLYGFKRAVRSSHGRRPRVATCRDGPFAGRLHARRSAPTWIVSRAVNRCSMRRRVAAWVELHIEQGPVLVARELPIGIVTGIRGNVRHRVVRVRRRSRTFRRRAALAAPRRRIRGGRIDHPSRPALAHAAGARPRFGGHLGRDGNGQFGTRHRPYSGQRVNFSFEVRSQSKETLEAFYDLFVSECASYRGRTRRRIPARPAAGIRARHHGPCVGREAAGGRPQGLGLPDEEIPSGAGHDAAVFANAGIPSAMIFVRNENGSHNPREDDGDRRFHGGRCA